MHSINSANRMLNFQMESPTRIGDVTIISSGIKNVSNSFQFYADGASDARFQLPTGWLPNAIPPFAKCEPAVCQLGDNVDSLFLYCVELHFILFLNCISFLFSKKKLKYVQFMIFETVIFQPEYFLFKLRLLIPTSPAASASSFPKLVPSPNS